MRFVSGLAIAGVAAALSWVLVPVIGRLGVHVGLVDHPSARRVRARPVPTTGGLTIFLVFGAAMLLGYLFYHDFPWQLVPQLKVLLTGFVSIAMLGVVDDRLELRPIVKLAIQTLIVCGVVAGGLALEEVRFLLGPTVNIGWLGYPVAVVWFLLFMNALNLIDGLDGLAGGIAALASLGLLAVAAIKGNPLLFFAAAVLLGAIGGFLVHNFSHGRVYLGDVGSNGLGFLLAGVAIVGADNDVASSSVLIAGACMAVPTFDIVTSVMRRLLAGRGLMASDHGHIHHRLIGFGLSPRGVVLVLWGVTLFFGGQVLSIMASQGWVYSAAGLVAGAAVALTIIAQRKKNTLTTTRNVADEIFYLLGTRDSSTLEPSMDDSRLRTMIRNQIRREARFRRANGNGNGHGKAVDPTEVEPTERRPVPEPLASLLR
ncbi:MAG: MraY family glycosyltransferase [Candidatus Eisenbacteria bacterium]